MSAIPPNCTAPNCALFFPPEPNQSYLNFLRSADRPGRFIAEITVFPKSAAPLTYESLPNCGAPNCSIGLQEGLLTQPEVLTFSDHPVSFKPDDVLKPNLCTEARLARRVDIQTIFSVVPNTSEAGQVLTGDIEIFNADRFLDDYVTDFAVDGRKVRLLFGPEGGTYSEFRLIEQTYGQDWRGNERTLRLTVQDLQFKLDRPFAEVSYRGTGQIEGTSNLLGRLKPRLIGERFNFEPLLIDPANYVYQIHDGSIEEVVRISDGGADYTNSGLDFTTYATLINATLEEGQFATALNLGLVRTRPAGGSPQSVVTARAKGENAGGYRTAIGDLILYEIRERARFAGEEIDAGSFAALNAFDGGYWFSGESEATFRDVLTELAGDTNGRIIADSRIRAIRIRDPQAFNFSFELDEHEIFRIEPEGVVYTPIYKTTVSYRPNDRVLSDSEVLNLEDATADKLELQKQALTVSRFDGTTAMRHLGAQSLVEVETNLIDEDSAVALLDTIQGLWRQERMIYRIVGPREAMFWTVGSIVKITHRRFGFESGRNALIVERRNDYNAQQAEFRVLV